MAASICDERVNVVRTTIVRLLPKLLRRGVVACQNDVKCSHYERDNETRKAYATKRQFLDHDSEKFCFDSLNCSEVVRHRGHFHSQKQFEKTIRTDEGNDLTKSEQGQREEWRMSEEAERCWRRLPP